MSLTDSELDTYERAIAEYRKARHDGRIYVGLDDLSIMLRELREHRKLVRAIDNRGMRRFLYDVDGEPRVDGDDLGSWLVSMMYTKSEMLGALDGHHEPSERRGWNNLADVVAAKIEGASRSIVDEMVKRRRI